MKDHWIDAAQIRKHQIESGKDKTFHYFFWPIYSEILHSLAANRILEIGAGTGHLTKKIASTGVDVTALEPSTSMYNVARETLRDSNVELLKLSCDEYFHDSKFDLVISHMCMHTAENIDAFFKTSYKNLKKGGFFYFTIPHPCFYHLYKNYFGDSFSYNKQSGKLVELTISTDRNTKMNNVPYIHRPLSTYINTAEESGFTNLRIMEPLPNKEAEKHYPEQWKFPRYCIISVKK